MGPAPLVGQGTTIQLFKNMVTFHIKLYEMTNAETSVHILSLLTHSTALVGSKVKTFFILKVVMLHIKIKGMTNAATCKSIFCHIPSTPEVGSKVKTFFLQVVMLHIKLNGISNVATCKNIFYPYTHSRPLGCGQRSKHFSASSHVAYQINANGA